MEDISQDRNPKGKKDVAMRRLSSLQKAQLGIKGATRALRGVRIPLPTTLLRRLLRLFQTTPKQRDRRSLPPPSRGDSETGQGDSSHILPLRLAGGEGNQLQYWPFSTSDLYNWKTHNPSFSQDPQALTALIESILLTHQPTWDDCQQLLQVLLTTEEKQRVILEAQKHVPGADGRPTQLPNEIEAAFPLTRPAWDFNTAEGREHLRLYRQVLVAGLQGAGRRPTNLAKVRSVTQGADKPPTVFLERLKEAYRRYTPFDPDSPDQEVSVSMSFIWQSAPDIRSKLQRMENLQGQGLRDLLREAERIFNKRETPEEKEERQKREAEDREAWLRITFEMCTMIMPKHMRSGRSSWLSACRSHDEGGHWLEQSPHSADELHFWSSTEGTRSASDVFSDPSSIRLWEPFTVTCCTIRHKENNTCFTSWGRSL
ncbi:uncharacterized protein LOC108490838 [Nannospalax galili]|uniref:uncharacterized protein LOC108490838 n=1 Tax=Nannospalax galili TaxID=1026970 RepID=UPI000819CCE8|nr:uncharacterized protein LOC108490838 [Nannospalax galili]